jgi:uncharacterized protein YdhG (YjbR/CyaY superfamily)
MIHAPEIGQKQTIRSIIYLWMIGQQEGSMDSKKFMSMDEYIASQPADRQKLLQELRALIKETAPDAQEKISYQMPTFALKGKNLVHFAAFKNHIGFYPTPRGIEAFQEELSGYKMSKGAIQFPIDKPLPLDLIRRIVEMRVAEQQ